MYYICVTDMKIFINHQEHEVADGATLAEVLTQLGLDRPGIATAIGSKVVKKDERAACVLTDGADIIIIKAVCGG